MRRVFFLCFPLFFASCVRPSDTRKLNQYINEIENQPTAILTITDEEYENRISLLDKFSTGARKGDKIRSLYLKGCYYLSRGEQKKALISFTKASQTRGRKVNDIKYLGLLNLELEKIYQADNPAQAESHRLLSDICFNSLGIAQFNGSSLLSLLPGLSLLGASRELDYYSKSYLYNELNESSNKHRILVICLFFFLLSSLGLFVLFHNRLLNKTRELKEVIRDYTGYKQSAKSTTELLVAILACIIHSRHALSS